MTVVIVDSSPLNYLTMIGSVDVLHQLYGAVVVPQQVIDELIDPAAPHGVRAWASNLPHWIDVREVVISNDDMTQTRRFRTRIRPAYRPASASVQVITHAENI